MELKELEIRLACNFASQLNKALSSRFGSALAVLFNPIFMNPNHLLLTALKLNPLRRVRFLPLNFPYSKLWIGFFLKLKNRQIRDDKTNDTPNYALFRAILKSMGYTEAMCIQEV